MLRGTDRKPCVGAVRVTGELYVRKQEDADIFWGVVRRHGKNENKAARCDAIPFGLVKAVSKG